MKKMTKQNWNKTMSDDGTEIIGIDAGKVGPYEESVEEVVEKIEDNIVEAVNKVASSIDMSVKTIIKTDDGPIDKTVLIRTTEYDRDRWKQSAELCGISLSVWIRELLNNEARMLLECNHPMNTMKIYPWAKICGKCNKRLSGKS